MPRKDFTDERVSKKQRAIDKKRRRQQKKETQESLNKHRLGWTTRDGKEL